MKYENDRQAKSIDQRLKLVEKCVDDTLRNQLSSGRRADRKMRVLFLSNLNEALAQTLEQLR